MSHSLKMNKCFFNRSYLPKQAIWKMTKEYFRRSILPRISTFGLWEIKNLFDFDVSSGITTNGIIVKDGSKGYVH